MDTASSNPKIETDDSRLVFQRLAAEWKLQAEFLSSPSAIAEQRAYVEIIEIGWKVIPLILDELRREPDQWFIALKRITGEDPVPDDARGDVDQMAEAWLNWGREHDIRFDPPAVTRVSRAEAR